MSTVTGVEIDLLEAARSFAPTLKERAADGEQRRTMPVDLVERARTLGLFHLDVPAALGGHECDPAVGLEIVEELSRADGSAGWTIAIGNITAVFAWLDPQVARRIMSAPAGALAATAWMPTGVADRTGIGDFCVTGRWSFVSGCRHADWFVNAVFVTDPHTAAEGPEVRFALFPSSEAQVIDTWDASGLRGTGSHDVTANAVSVPDELTVSPFDKPARHDGPLYRLPFFTLADLRLAGFTLGVARRALDEFEALAPLKSRAIPPLGTLAHDESVQVEVARAEGLVRSARAFVFDALGRAWDTVLRGDPITTAQRANIGLSVLHAGRTCRAAVDNVYALAGGAALRNDNPLQRCARDICAGTQHIRHSLGSWKAPGRVALGLAPDSVLF